MSAATETMVACTHGCSLSERTRDWSDEDVEADAPFVVGSRRARRTSGASRMTMAVSAMREATAASMVLCTSVKASEETR